MWGKHMEDHFICNKAQVSYLRTWAILWCYKPDGASSPPVWENKWKMKIPRAWNRSHGYARVLRPWTLFWRITQWSYDFYSPPLFLKLRHSFTACSLGVHDHTNQCCHYSHEYLVNFKVRVWPFIHSSLIFVSEGWQGLGYWNGEQSIRLTLFIMWLQCLHVLLLHIWLLWQYNQGDALSHLLALQYL